MGPLGVILRVLGAMSKQQSGIRAESALTFRTHNPESTLPQDLAVSCKSWGARKAARKVPENLPEKKYYGDFFVKRCGARKPAPKVPEKFWLRNNTMFLGRGLGRGSGRGLGRGLGRSLGRMIFTYLALHVTHIEFTPDSDVVRIFIPHVFWS